MIPMQEPDDGPFVKTTWKVAVLALTVLALLIFIVAITRSFTVQIPAPQTENKK